MANQSFTRRPGKGKFAYVGIDLHNPPDLIPEGKAPFLLNVSGNQSLGTLQARAGLTNITGSGGNIIANAAGLVVNSFNSTAPTLTPIPPGPVIGTKYDGTVTTGQTGSTPYTTSQNFANAYAVRFVLAHIYQSFSGINNGCTLTVTLPNGQTITQYLVADRVDPSSSTNWVSQIYVLPVNPPCSVLTSNTFSVSTVNASALISAISVQLSEISTPQGTFS